MKRTPLARRSPMRRSGRRAGDRPTPQITELTLEAVQPNGFHPETRHLIRLRAGWKCERCGGRDVAHYHHRRPKGAGGSSVPWVQWAANGTLLCRRCHDWAHANPRAAYETGWLIPKTASVTAEDIPVVTLAGRRWWFTDQGAKLAHQPPKETT